MKMNIRKAMGFVAIAALMALGTPVERAQALSLASPGASSTAKYASEAMTTEVRGGRGGRGGGRHFGGGGRHFGGGFHRGGGRHFGHRHFGYRHYGFRPRYYGPSYYYAPRPRCRIVSTYYGPRRICRPYRYW